MKKQPLIVVLALLLITLAPTAIAQSVAVTEDGRIVVAHDAIIELFSANGTSRLWRNDGVVFPGQIAVGRKLVAALDPMSGRIAIAALDSGRVKFLETHDTPIDAAFVGNDLFVLERDEGRLERIAEDGFRTTVVTGAYPEFLRIHDGRIYVYSRGDGLFQEFTPEPLALNRSVRLPPFASAFELDAAFGYLVYPEEAKLRVVRLDSLVMIGDEKIGDAPVALSVASGPTPLTAATLFLADPASKRIWTVEAPQSTAAAVGRGFLRGLLGIGAFRGADPLFRTGVDRVQAAGNVLLAYDSSSRNLYKVISARTRGELVAVGIAPHAFALSTGRIIYWNGTLVAQKP